MAVITPTGIVGKIVQVSPSSAQVLPINDQLSGVGAALKDSRLQGILKGAANGTTTLQYIMSDEPVKPGEPVITSGGDRIFPKGLQVGTVASVEPGKDLFLNIRVIPSARLDRLEEVLVITNIQTRVPDASDLGPIRASDILSQRLPGVPVTPAVDAAGNAITQPGAMNTGQGSSAPGNATGAPGAVKPANPAGTGLGQGVTKPAGADAAKKPNPTTATPATTPAKQPPTALPHGSNQAPATTKPKTPEALPQ